MNIIGGEGKKYVKKRIGQIKKYIKMGKYMLLFPPLKYKLFFNYAFFINMNQKNIIKLYSLLLIKHSFLTK